MFRFEMSCAHIACNDSDTGNISIWNLYCFIDKKNLALHICMQVWFMNIFKFKFAITIQVHKYIALNYSNMYAVILKRSVLCIWFCRFSKFKFITTITLGNVVVKITTAKQNNVWLARSFKNYKVQ